MDRISTILNSMIIPPFQCIFCQSKGPFDAEEHLVPESLGNKFLILDKGWVCNCCNGKFSQFEGRVLSKSFLALQRVQLGVTTKKGKPAVAEMFGAKLHAVPEAKRKIYIPQDDLKKMADSSRKINGRMLLIGSDSDDTKIDISRLLLKMGIETCSITKALQKAEILFRFNDAKNYVIGLTDEPWPYFSMRTKDAKKYLKSRFFEDGFVHHLVTSFGFDLFLHPFEKEIIFFFEYGFFFAGICLTSRETKWQELLKKWETSYFGCPSQFQKDYWLKPDEDVEPIYL